MRSGKQYSTRQQGAVLIISIVLLVVLTLLGIYLSQSGLLEFRMAENAASRNIALQMAEAARSAAQQKLTVVAKDMDATTNAYDCTKWGAGYYAAADSSARNPLVTGCTPLNPEDLNWNARDSQSSGAGKRYVIEYLGVQDMRPPLEAGVGEEKEYHVFRILARGIDNAGGNVILQSIHAKRNLNSVN